MIRPKLDPESNGELPQELYLIYIRCSCAPLRFGSSIAIKLTYIRVWWMIGSQQKKAAHAQ